MKPTNWNTWSPEQKKEYAVQLFHSFRGQYILSQALHYGIKAMREQKFPEESNAQDMEMIRECLFPWFMDPDIVREEMKKHGLSSYNSNGQVNLPIV